jgi:hypothetical protein
MERLDLTDAEDAYLSALVAGAGDAASTRRSTGVVMGFRPASEAGGAWQLITVTTGGPDADWSQFPIEDWELQMVEQGFEQAEGRLEELRGRPAVVLRLFDNGAGITTPPEGAWVTVLQFGSSGLSSTVTLTTPASTSEDTDLALLFSIAETIESVDRSP